MNERLSLEELLEHFSSSSIGNALRELGLDRSGSRADQIDRLLELDERLEQRKGAPTSTVLAAFGDEELAGVCAELDISTGESKGETVARLEELLGNKGYTVPPLEELTGRRDVSPPAIKLGTYIRLWYQLGPLVRIPWRIWIPFYIALGGILLVENYAHPILNLLLVLYALLGHSMGIAIVTLAVLVRMLTLPVTLRQIRNNRRVHQAEHASSGEEPIAAEATSLHGWPMSANPWVGIGPMLLQLPMWGAINGAIHRTTASSPEALVEWASYLYGWLPAIHSIEPIETSFIWLDLRHPDPSPFLLPLAMYFGMAIAMVISRVRVHWAVKWLFPAPFAFFR